MCRTDYNAVSVKSCGFLMKLMEVNNDFYKRKHRNQVLGRAAILHVLNEEINLPRTTTLTSESLHSWLSSLWKQQKSNFSIEKKIFPKLLGGGGGAEAPPAPRLRGRKVLTMTLSLNDSNKDFYFVGWVLQCKVSLCERNTHDASSVGENCCSISAQKTTKKIFLKTCWEMKTPTRS